MVLFANTQVIKIEITWWWRRVKALVKHLYLIIYLVLKLFPKNLFMNYIITHVIDIKNYIDTK